MNINHYNSFSFQANLLTYSFTRNSPPSARRVLAVTENTALYQMSSQSLRSALISRPTILIIHGAWHTPLHFAPLTAYLFSYEYPAIVVSLPSTGNPDKGLDDDIATITSHLKELVEVQGREVLLVTHAYGGIPGSGAVGPFVRSQRVEGLPGGVVGILWMCSAIRSKGNGLVSDFKAGYPPWMVVTVRFQSAQRAGRQAKKQQISPH